ncbi:hypothetical protein [Massilia sp. METH4]|uniref:hypothetical protein n=1 Tax=Massilia sp. METH4 TaxID=3123041 RepID=UPI0030D52392
MKKHWKDVIVSAAPLIAFLERQSYFDRPFDGDPSNKLVLKDGGLALRYAVDDSFEEFDNWETVSDSSTLFPNSFEWNSWIDHNLMKNRCFGLTEKNFHGADVKLSGNVSCVLHELMWRDMNVLLNCYSNEYFPRLWQEMLKVYLSNGFPCGWHGRYPEGKLVVFSNH